VARRPARLRAIVERRPLATRPTLANAVASAAAAAGEEPVDGDVACRAS
jgi:hypothetical protein